MATIRALVTLDRLIEAGVHPTQARNFLEPLQEAAHQFGIDTPARFAAFLAQAMHESAGLTRLEEGLIYRTPERIMAVWPSRFPSIADAMPMVRNPRGLANRVYAGRMGNGDEASGDGWRFRGRGIFQLTGRDNYRRAGIACGRPYESAPDVVADPRDACRSPWRACHQCPVGLSRGPAHGSILWARNAPRSSLAGRWLTARAR